jgi:hypothetical protein
MKLECWIKIRIKKFKQNRIKIYGQNDIQM